MRLMVLTRTFGIFAFFSLPAIAQQSPVAPARTEVLVLGLYHMANPGRDIVNMKVDDVLAPRRQAEIAEVIEVLRKFNPSKIAVEAGFDNTAILKRYDDYVAGKHALSRNETEQIGFRLARELGHQKIFPVDADGEFPFPRLVDYAKARGTSVEFDALLAESADRVKATNEYLTSHTVLQTLLHLNADEKVTWDVGHYYRMARFGEPWNWAGADLVADWFRRNMRIYSNVVDLVEGPGERVLVIFGYGHTGWLQHNFASDPTMRLRKLAEFAK